MGLRDLVRENPGVFGAIERMEKVCMSGLGLTFVGRSV